MHKFTPAAELQTTAAGAASRQVRSLARSQSTVMKSTHHLSRNRRWQTSLSRPVSLRPRQIAGGLPMQNWRLAARVL